MFEWRRSNSCQLPRHKIYLTSLNQLIDRKIVQQPEVQTNKKLFPERTHTRRLSTSHQRTKSSVQLRSRKFDLHWTSRNNKNMVVESNRLGTTHQAKRESLAHSQQLRPTHLSQPYRRLDTKTNPILKINLAPSMSSPDAYNLSAQNMTGVTHSLQLKCESPQKNFLRKGSNLQKQIVINLLRNKLMKQRQFNEKKEYSNQQIIKMIQVFKGVTLNESTKPKKGLLDSGIDAQSLLLKKNEMKELKGWEEQPGDYQLHEEK